MQQYLILWKNVKIFGTAFAKKFYYLEMKRRRFEATWGKVFASLGSKGRYVTGTVYNIYTYCII